MSSGTTAVYSIPYPVPADPVNVASDMQSLAERVDTVLNTIESELESGENFLINGNFLINERNNTALILSANAQFIVDRFFVRRIGSTTTASALLTATGGPTGLPTYARITRNGGSTTTDPLCIGQTLESVTSRVLAGKTVTLSFYARKSAGFSGAGSNLGVILYTGTGTDEAGIGSGYTGSVAAINSTATLTTSWQRFSYTATLASTANQIQVLLKHDPIGTASNDAYEVTGFKLETGSTATPFSLAGGGSYINELVLCRRYFERISADSSSSYVRFGTGYATGATAGKLTIQYKVTKRSSSITSFASGVGLLSALNDTVYALSNFSNNQLNKDSGTFLINVTGSSFTTGQYLEVVSNNSSTGYFQVDAEIG